MENKIRVISIDTEDFSLDEVIGIVKKELDKIVPQKIPPPGQKLIDSWLTP